MSAPGSEDALVHLIAAATHEELANAVRLLALTCARYWLRFGDLPASGNEEEDAQLLELAAARRVFAETYLLAQLPERKQ